MGTTITILFMKSPGIIISVTQTGESSGGYWSFLLFCSSFSAFRYKGQNTKMLCE